MTQRHEGVLQVWSRFPCPISMVGRDQWSHGEDDCGDYDEDEDGGVGVWNFSNFVIK